MKLDIPPDKLKILKKKSDWGVWIVIIAVVSAIILAVIMNN